MTTRYLLDELVVDGSRVTAKAHPEFHSRYLSEEFFVEYDNNISLETIDTSILAIPFLLNVLPLVWLSGETYYIDTLDVEFSQSLETIRNVLRRLHPGVAWEGELIAEQMVSHPSAATATETAVLFSGGVDSIHTALQHREVPQVLIKILSPRGPGLRQSDRDNDAVRAYVRSFAGALGNQGSFAVSNLPYFISSSKLVGVWPRPRRWLIEIQYGLGFVGITAPVIQQRGIKKLLMAGCELDHYGLPSGSHPDIVNSIRWTSVEVLAKGVETKRQQKVSFVHELLSAHRDWRVELKPCLRPKDGFANCCECSKCLQTILGIIGEEGNPREYGFDIEPRVAFQTLKKQIATQQLPLPDVGELLQWIDIQMSIRRIAVDLRGSSSSACGYAEELLWFAGFDLTQYFARVQGGFWRTLRSARTRIALRLDSWLLFGEFLRKLLRPFLQWR